MREKPIAFVSIWYWVYVLKRNRGRMWFFMIFLVPGTQFVAILFDPTFTEWLSFLLHSSRDFETAEVWQGCRLLVYWCHRLHIVSWAIGMCSYTHITLCAWWWRGTCMLDWLQYCTDINCTINCGMCLLAVCLWSNAFDIAEILKYWQILRTTLVRCSHPHECNEARCSLCHLLRLRSLNLFGVDVVLLAGLALSSHTLCIWLHGCSLYIVMQALRIPTLL